MTPQIPGVIFFFGLLDKSQVCRDRAIVRSLSRQNAYVVLAVVVGVPRACRCVPNALSRA